MKQHLVRYVPGFVVLLVLLGHSARFYQIPFINNLDAIFYDAKVQLPMPQKMDDRVVILDIDEKSLAEFGHWPWRRDQLATLVNRLFDQYHASVLGFDVFFPERDESSGLKSMSSLADNELEDNSAFQAALRELKPRLDYAARFAAALKGRPLILAFSFNNDEKTSAGVLPPPVLPAGTFQGRHIPFASWTGHSANLPEFQEAAAGGGHIAPLVEFDGTTRRV